MNLRSLLQPGVRQREFWSWACYDFANSSYTTVVSTAVFNVYFVATVAADRPWATFAWTLAVSLAAAVVMALGPLIGAAADASGRKQPWLRASTLACVVGTLGLMAVGPGDVALAIVFVVISAVGFGLGEGVIAAWLPLLGRPHALGRLSGYGWALGYLGGLAALALCLVYVQVAQARGAGAADFVPGCMAITAVFFALAALPGLLVLGEHAPQRPPPRGSLVDEAFGRLHRTWREGIHLTDLRRLLLTIAGYQSGVAIVVALAAIYAQQAMGFDTADTLELVLVVNITAALGAFAFGWVQDRIGHGRALKLSLWLWLAMVATAYFATTRSQFWVAANLAGIAMGASQSAGRAMVAYLSPPDRVAEYFGLWSVAMRIATIVGPICYGLATIVLAGNHRLAMLCTGAFFAFGLVVLHGVDVQRGRAAAYPAA
ncbi:MAG: MFS transporter [Xanthomonadales bacterium]|nr:MFS transporter [Xanthomonadales bacterium]MCE7930184.1 MFS transporter [Xanthomonadales bacterium PRO6]